MTGSGKAARKKHPGTRGRALANARVAKEAQEAAKAREAKKRGTESG